MVEPLDLGACLDVDDHRSSQPENVDAGVLVVALVLRGDDSLTQRARDVRQRHELAVLVGEQVGDRLAVAVDDPRRQVGAFERLGRIGQPRGHAVDHDTARDAERYEHQHQDQQGDTQDGPAALGAGPSAGPHGAARLLRDRPRGVGTRGPRSGGGSRGSAPGPGAGGALRASVVGVGHTLTLYLCVDADAIGRRSMSQAGRAEPRILRSLAPRNRPRRMLVWPAKPLPTTISAAPSSVREVSRPEGED